jgi:hypothetical protein
MSIVGGGTYHFLQPFGVWRAQPLGKACDCANNVACLIPGNRDRWAAQFAVMHRAGIWRPFARIAINNDRFMVTELLLFEWAAVNNVNLEEKDIPTGRIALEFRCKGATVPNHFDAEYFAYGGQHSLGQLSLIWVFLDHSRLTFSGP